MGETVGLWMENRLGRASILLLLARTRRIWALLTKHVGIPPPPLSTLFCRTQARGAWQGRREAGGGMYSRAGDRREHKGPRGAPRPRPLPPKSPFFSSSVLKKWGHWGSSQ